MQDLGQRQGQEVWNEPVFSVENLVDSTAERHHKRNEYDRPRLRRRETRYAFWLKLGRGERLS